MKIKTSSVALMILLITGQVHILVAQDTLVQRYANTITDKELEAHIQFLASEDMMGRKPGQGGIDKAAYYLRNQFGDYQLESPEECNPDYLQAVKLVRENWLNLSICADKDTFLQGETITGLGQLPELDGSFELIFAGFGINSEHYNDYKDVEVQGKVVAYLIGEPRDKNGRSLVSGTIIPAFDRNSDNKDSIAYAYGAVATIRIDPVDELASSLIKMYKKFNTGNQLSLEQPHNNEIPAKGTVYIGKTDAAKLLGIEQDKFEKEIKRLEIGKAHRITHSRKIQLTIKRGENNAITSYNVAGMIRGSEYPDEYLVVTAHYDHLGKKGEYIYYGADDNATGTAAILEAAQAFSIAASEGFTPKKSILFLPVTAEEIGLLGSRYYVEHPLVPLDKTEINLNMDMIGRQSKERTTPDPYVFLYISDQPESLLENLARQAYQAIDAQFEVEYINKTSSGMRTGGSDHFSFESKGIKVLYFFNGLHEDYHHPTDTWDKIDYQQLTNTTRYVFSTLWILANDNNQLY